MKHLTVDEIIDFLMKASEYKKDEAHFMLHCFDLSTITLDECVKIISSLHNVPICKKLGFLYNKSIVSVDVGNMKQRRRIMRLKS